MGRPLRAAAGGIIYHVWNRANGRQGIFEKDISRGPAAVWGAWAAVWDGRVGGAHDSKNELRSDRPTTRTTKKPE